MSDTEALAKIAAALRRLSPQAVYLATRLDPASHAFLDALTDILRATRATDDALLAGQPAHVPTYMDQIRHLVDRLNGLWSALCEPEQWRPGAIYQRRAAGRPGGDLVAAYAEWADAPERAMGDPDHAWTHLEQAAKRMSAAVAPHQNELTWAEFYAPVLGGVYAELYEVLRAWYRKEPAQLAQLRALVHEVRPALAFPLRQIDLLPALPAPRELALALIAAVARDVSVGTVEAALRRSPPKSGGPV
jgi:hypothetical protein